jgi:hypothetical protein
MRRPSSILSAVAVLFLANAISLLPAQERMLPQAKRFALRNFIAKQRSDTFDFWMAHAPDGDDPKMAILWMAPAGSIPKDAEGVLIYVIADDPQGLACLKTFRRGSIGRITLMKNGYARICGATVLIVEFDPF